MNLQAAIDAVRDESVERGTAELMTRRRVLASIERAPSRRLHAVVAAVIASMFGASAFAWYARAPEPAATPTIVHEAGAVAAVEPVVAPERTAAHVEPATVEEAIVEPAPVVAATVEHAPVASHEPRATPAAPPIATAQPVPDPELALYATAHRLHFQDRALVAAVEAWDRYLAIAPTGKLAPEARFNRLVALVRLQRWDDAAHALATFDDPTFRPADLAKLRSLVEARRPR